MQRALIVDDSKTAQIRLKKLLAKYELIVDVSFSAEEALGYLSYRQPAVIFMDHHMEGMDGFEALKIIKANPDTAMIPVVMYTAQQGDVYIGQARALGALDILSKDIMKAASLERVLSGIDITPNQTAADNSATGAATNSASTAQNTAASNAAAPKGKKPSTIEPLSQLEEPHFSEDSTANIEQVATQIARLFKLHLSEIRQLITDNSRFVVRRLGDEIIRASNKEPTVGDVPLSVINDELNAEQRKSNVVSSSLLILIFIGLALIAYEIFNSKQQLSELQNNYKALLTINQQNSKLLNSHSTRQQPNVVGSTSKANSGLLNAISWAMDVDMSFPWQSPPLSEMQVLKINDLVYRLASGGFRGTVELDINFGNFCLQQTATGELKMAADTTLIENCIFSGDLTTDYSAKNYLTLPYLNFERDASPIQGGLIGVMVETNGISSPRADYPTATENLTAGEWNKIAAKNNRISISLE